ncbi:MAG: 5-dehydro-4-deoxy-D-glucuronate isomerase [Anditalea sp.]
MAIQIITRHASHPDDVRHYDTQKLREHFLLESIFETDQITGVYSTFDRLIVGGIHPVNGSLSLETVYQLKAEYFLERREMGIINIGSPTTVTVEGTDYKLNKKEALYIGKGAREVIFHPANEGKAFLYFNSAPAHHAYPTKKVGMEEAEKVEMGSLENSNHRIINKLIVNPILKTCQLQMGLTELKTGSVWNTMPAHTHDRRMEAYFYFDLPEDQMVCHYMGQPQETRHIWMKNHQAVISPAWSIHSGSGTSHYSFIWGMAGENLDYGDMDKALPTELL